MATATKMANAVKQTPKIVHNWRALSVTTAQQLPERFGDPNGSSGWKWEKGGIGMGGKDAGKATEVKPDMGKNKAYQVPEYFSYNNYSFYDLEKSMDKQRVPQPNSGLSEFW